MEKSENYGVMEAKEGDSVKKQSGVKCIKHCQGVSCEEDLKVSVGFREIEAIGTDESRFCRGLHHIILGPSLR